MKDRRSRHHGAFLGSEAAEDVLAKARYVILPLPYERTTSYGKGTVKGPAAILAASEQVELFIDELGTEPCQAGVYTAPPVRFPPGSSPARNMARISQAVERFLSQGKFVVSLGGEHTITVGAVKPFIERYPDLTVVQVDAHADLRECYEDNPLSHACTMRRIIDRCYTLHVGIRSLSVEEAALIRKRNLQVWWARDIRRQRNWQKQVAANLGKHAYLSIDLDALDPSIMPSTGTPEPGGLSWWDVISLAREIAASGKLVGADVTELSPSGGARAPDFTAAKLVYHIIGYAEMAKGKSQRRQGVHPGR